MRHLLDLAWITWEEVQSCTADPHGEQCLIAEGVDQIETALHALRRKKCPGPLFAGYDVARKHDKAVLALLEKSDNTLKLVALFVLKNTSFDQQRRLLERVTPLINRGCIDATGLGANLAEDMHRYASGWKEVVFSHPVKSELAVDMRQRFQQGTIIIPACRDLQRDVHSIRRIVTQANNTIYEVGRDAGAEVDDGHADMFWALALAVRAHKSGGGIPFVDPQRFCGARTLTGINQATRKLETVSYKLAHEVIGPGDRALGTGS